MFLEGIKSGNTPELEVFFAEVKEADITAASKLFITKLESVLEGNRDLSIAEDIGLYYMNAVELHLLVEGLQ